MVCISITFGCSMPILYFFTFLSLLGMYFINRKIYLNYAVESPRYSPKVINSVINILKTLIFIYFWSSFLFLSNPDIFPAKKNLVIDLNDKYFKTANYPNFLEKLRICWI